MGLVVTRGGKQLVRFPSKGVQVVTRPHVTNPKNLSKVSVFNEMPRLGGDVAAWVHDHFRLYLAPIVLEVKAVLSTVLGSRRCQLESTTAFDIFPLLLSNLVKVTFRKLNWVALSTDQCGGNIV